MAHKRKPQVISQHLEGEPRVIVDLEGQGFLLPGAEPDPEPEQGELFEDPE